MSFFGPHQVIGSDLLSPVSLSIGLNRQAQSLNVELEPRQEFPRDGNFAKFGSGLVRTFTSRRLHRARKIFTTDGYVGPLKESSAFPVDLGSRTAQYNAAMGPASASSNSCHTSVHTNLAHEFQRGDNCEHAPQNLALQISIVHSMSFSFMQIPPLMS